MKKKNKNMKGNSLVKSLGLCNLISLGVMAIGVILVIVGFVVDEYLIPLRMFGMLTIATPIVIRVSKHEKHALLKMLGVIFLTTLALTWVVPNGAYSGTTFTDLGLVKVGLSDIPVIIYYAAYFTLDKIAYLLVLAGFYSLLSKIPAYNKLVSNIAGLLEKRLLPFLIGLVVFFVVLTSLFSQVFLVLFFVPFIISILSKLKVDKILAFVATFGAILVGFIGAPYGTEGLTAFNSYTGVSDITIGLDYRMIIQAAALILFTLFIVLRLKGYSKKELTEAVEDPYILEEGKKNSTVGMIIILAITTILIVLGYVSWSTNFEITFFNELHTNILDLKIGEDFYIFSDVLGTSSLPFGSWDVLIGICLLLGATFVTAIVYKVSVSKIFEAFAEGFKIISKPLILMICAYLVFIVIYTSAFTASFAHWSLMFTNEFNPNTSALYMVIASIFHVDLGFTGYSISTYLTGAFSDHSALANTVITTMYGFSQMFLPTSVILLIGLSYTKLSYRAWIKYIWMFLVGIFVILLVFFNVIYFIG